MIARHERYSELVAAPQIVRNVPLLTFFIPAPPNLRDFIPSPLALRSGGHLVLNIWSLQDPQQTTGFGRPGPIGVTYLAVEVEGEEGGSADGETRFAGRLWLEHWSSSPAARSYAERVSGLVIEPGEVSVTHDRDIVTMQLNLGGSTVVRAEARVGNDCLKTVSGHSIYYAERQGILQDREVARFEVPWVSDVYSAKDAHVEFCFPRHTSVCRYLTNGTQSVSAVTFRRITLVPYLASGIVQMTGG